MSTPPRVRAFLLVDGHSVAMLDQFKVLIHELDRASGDHLDIVAFGDPALTGPHAVAYRSAQEVAETPVLAADYVREVVQTGRDSHHVVKESREQARLLGIAESQLPCIALLDRCTAQVITTLRIEREWGEAEASRRAAERGFESGLGERSLVVALAKYDGSPSAAGTLAREFARLGHATSSEVARSMGTSMPKRILEVPKGVILELRETTRTCRFHGQDIHLTDGQFRFLLRLAREPGVFITHEELANAARRWADDAGGNAPQRIADLKWQTLKVLRAGAHLAEEGTSDKEVNALIESRPGVYRLNVPRECVWTA